MIAGTLTLLDQPLDAPMESHFASGQLPAIEVSMTQDTLDDRPIQSGTVAGAVDYDATVPQVATVGAPGDDARKTIITEQRERSEAVVTDWVADPTDTGLLVIESIPGSGDLPWPLELFLVHLSTEPVPQYVDVGALHDAWVSDDGLADVWLNAGGDEDATTIAYHDDADRDARATIGLGFRRQWGDGMLRGVVYESGYLAVYNCYNAVEFVRFACDEILPHCSAGEPTDDDADQCRRCDRVSDSLEDGLCIVCRDKQSEESDEDQETFANLDTVGVTDGGDDDGE